MVLLLTYSIIVFLGFVALALGYFTGYAELGVIGGILILGSGAAVLEFGLEVESGEIRTESEDNETVVEDTYRPVETNSRMSLGFVTMLLGAAAILRSLQELGEG